MAQNVFYSPDQWPTTDANIFIVENLTLVPYQNKDLESDLHLDEFLKEFKCLSRYKPHFMFKT